MTTITRAIAPTGWGDLQMKLPAMGNIEAYIRAVNLIPMLTPEEEFRFATQLQEHNDLAAAGKLVMSHLRLVVSTARQFSGYGFAVEDLIQEGTIGLMKAVKKFDPKQGVRLVSYALHWIRSEITDFVIRNYRMAKIATTKAHRKLFFNLRQMKQRFEQDGSGQEPARSTLNDNEVKEVARTLNVKEEDVREMETRLMSFDFSLEAGMEQDDDDAFTPIMYLSDNRQDPTVVIEQKRRDIMTEKGISQALDVLDERSKDIITSRWLDINDDSSGGMTLHELAAKYGVSAERIRQIEANAMRKMRQVLQEYA